MGKSISIDLETIARGYSSETYRRLLRASSGDSIGRPASGWNTRSKTNEKAASPIRIEDIFWGIREAGIDDIRIIKESKVNRHAAIMFICERALFFGWDEMKNAASLDAKVRLAHDVHIDCDPIAALRIAEAGKLSFLIGAHDPKKAAHANILLLADWSGINKHLQRMRKFKPEMPKKEEPKVATMPSAPIEIQAPPSKITAA